MDTLPALLQPGYLEQLREESERIEDAYVRESYRAILDSLSESVVPIRAFLQKREKQAARKQARKGSNSDFTKAGDVSVVKQLGQRQHQKLLAAAVAIHEQPDAAERAFMARQLVQRTLPHSNPGDVPLWKRSSGNNTLAIQPGIDIDTEKSIGYPYGTIPRLLLFWLTTEVQHTKNRPDLSLMEKRTLQLGSSLDTFMREIGLNPDTGGGKRSDAKRLHNQMDRLFSSRIGWVNKQNIGTEEGIERGTMQVSPRFVLWWNPKEPRQATLMQNWVLLGEEFYNALVNNPVPVDLRALKALKRSPLALDLYAWSCYQAFVIIKKKLPHQFVAWATLKEQFGADYKSVDELATGSGGGVPAPAMHRGYDHPSWMDRVFSTRISCRHTGVCKSKR
jgi:hypothetical protein